MTNKTSSIHKTLLILILVFVPPFWLLFTDEGARVSDRALLWLLGEKDIQVSIAKLDSSFTQSDIQAVYAEHGWLCEPRDTPLGDNLCAAQIGTFNGFPARVLLFYFRTDRVSAMKLIYRAPYHEQIMGHYIGSLGQPNNLAEVIAEDPDTDHVLQWQLSEGALLLKKVLSEPDEPALLWIATELPH